MHKPYRGNADTYVIPSYEPAPGLGLLPINAFLIKAKEPVLVDTGMAKDRKEFLMTLWSLIDPKELKWVFMTHEDGDHAGNLPEVMEAATGARLVTNFLGVAKLKASWDMPLNRVYLVNPGQSFNAGDRQLTALRPPLFDSGATHGLYDAKMSAFFSVDSFGALIQQPAEDAGDVPQADFKRGFGIFNQANHPWTPLVDQGKFEVVLERIRRMEVKTIFSSHLPAAHGQTDSLLKGLSAIPSMEPFVGPDQAALEAMLKQIAHTAPSGSAPGRA
ncbi:MAG: MBL fold metallo-hydrolase [Chloroflexota bacterium]|nr:MBL fold metallo-hydrolase [Chloroflexota bacterium]